MSWNNTRWDNKITSFRRHIWHNTPRTSIGRQNIRRLSSTAPDHRRVDIFMLLILAVVISGWSADDFEVICGSEQVDWAEVLLSAWAFIIAEYWGIECVGDLPLEVEDLASSAGMRHNKFETLDGQTFASETVNSFGNSKLILSGVWLSSL